nr:NADP oxidoreductase [Bacteroidota bacterium]
MKILLKNIEKQGYKSDLESYLKQGGYQSLKKALSLSSEEIIREVKASKLVGRGGAAFPTGLKWESAKKSKEFPKYVVCNADEG